MNEFPGVEPADPPANRGKPGRVRRAEISRKATEQTGQEAASLASWSVDPAGKQFSTGREQNAPILFPRRACGEILFRLVSDNAHYQRAAGAAPVRMSESFDVVIVFSSLMLGGEKVFGAASGGCVGELIRLEKGVFPLRLRRPLL